MRYHVVYQPGDVTYYTTNFTNVPTPMHLLDSDFMLNQPGTQVVTWQLNELPLTKRKIKFKFLTSNDELNITKETDALAKISGGISYSLTTRFKYQILSVDGVSDKASINSFVDNELLSRDSIELRNYIESITPDVDMSWQYTDDDGERRDFLVPVTVQFLWPNAKV